MAATSARSRVTLLSEAAHELRGQQPAARVLLLPAATFGKQLVCGLESNRADVNNHGAAVHAALTAWLDGWHRDTVQSAAKVDDE